MNVGRRPQGVFRQPEETSISLDNTQVGPGEVTLDWSADLAFSGEYTIEINLTRTGETPTRREYVGGVPSDNVIQEQTTFDIGNPNEEDWLATLLVIDQEVAEAQSWVTVPGTENGGNGGNGNGGNGENGGNGGNGIGSGEIAGIPTTQFVLILLIAAAFLYWKFEMGGDVPKVPYV